MASKTEGIALLSMYDDEEEEEEEEEQLHRQQQQCQVSVDDGGGRAPTDQPDEAAHDSIAAEQLPDSLPSTSPLNLSSPSPEIKSLRSPTPPPWPKFQRSSPLSLFSPSPTPPPRRPPPLPEAADGQKGRRGALAIVDYAHDEAAMSPEAEEEEEEEEEEGEITSSGRVVVGMEIQTSDGNFEERTPPGTVQLSTTQPEPPHPSDVPEQSRSQTSMAIDPTGTEPEIAQAEITHVVSEEVQIDDPLKSFLPPLVTTKCPAELLHAVRYQGIDQIGTCFRKDVFDPHMYDKSDYFDEIVSGISAGVTSGSVSTAPDATRDSRLNKKSKWDKIDGDVKNLAHSGGDDNLSAVGVHAAHLSAADAGSGYAAFAQQKRKEAEERRSGERKFDRRS